MKSPDTTPAILIVEDEPALLDILEASLHDGGFAVVRVAGGRGAGEAMRSERPDLVLIDLNHPAMAGLDALRAIRAHPDVPVITLTARGSDVWRVIGLELGADDPKTKPCSPREVVARVKAAPRRPAAKTSSERSLEPHGVRRLGEIVLDPGSREVTRRGERVHLTPTEYRLLEVLSARPGQAFTRDQLIDLISTHGGDVFERTLDRHIANLRQKIELDVQHPRYILTVFGFGYKISDVG